jgi:anti-sigma B factor antagonist
MSALDLNASLSNAPDGSLVVHLAGEIDMDSAPLITDCVSSALEAGQSRIAIDLRDVTFMDSRGLAALITAHEDASAAGAMLVVRAPTKRVLDVFMMTGIDRLLHIELT